MILALMIVAIILLALAAAGIPSNVGLGWAGLAFWALAELLARGLIPH